MRFLPIALATSLLLANAGIAQAGVPTQIDAQGVLRDAGGDLVDLPDATIVFRLYDAETGGALLWSETQDVPVMMGVFDTLLPESPLTELPTSVQTKLAIGAPLWLSIQLDGQDELPRTTLVSVPYAFTANRALMATGLDCSGCIDASDINSSTFTAQHMVYAPAGGDLVNATTVGGALGQLDNFLADHIANANGHHPADSAGIAIVPTSVTIGNTSLTDGTIDLGSGVNDALTKAKVETLTGGGNADALHKHTAQSISGLPAGGSCYQRWGTGSCAQGYSESNVGLGVYPYISHSAGLAMGPAVCAENISMPAGFPGVTSFGWATGGGLSSGIHMTCAMCCPAALDSGSCRTETFYKMSALYSAPPYNTVGNTSGPLAIGFTGRGYTVSSIEVMLSTASGVVGSASAYDLRITDSTGTVLDTSPLRYTRAATAAENSHQANYTYYYLHRADVAFALPANNQIKITIIAVANGQPADVLALDTVSYNPGRAWMAVTGCAVE